jgi:hypothetical protein
LGKRPSPAKASLRWHVDFALLRSVSLIETALQRETVAENPRCQALLWSLNDCRNRQAYSRRDVLGCSRGDADKNGSTTSKKKTVTANMPSLRVLARHRHVCLKKPQKASPFAVCAKIRQEPLDNETSFRDVPPAA